MRKFLLRHGDKLAQIGAPIAVSRSVLRVSGPVGVKNKRETCANDSSLCQENASNAQVFVKKAKIESGDFEGKSQVVASYAQVTAAEVGTWAGQVR